MPGLRSEVCSLAWPQGLQSCGAHRCRLFHCSPPSAGGRSGTLGSLIAFPLCRLFFGVFFFSLIQALTGMLHRLHRCCSVRFRCIGCLAFSLSTFCTTACTLVAIETPGLRFLERVSELRALGPWGCKHVKSCSGVLRISDGNGYENCLGGGTQ